MEEMISISNHNVNRNDNDLLMQRLYNSLHWHVYLIIISIGGGLMNTLLKSNDSCQMNVEEEERVQCFPLTCGEVLE